MVKQPIIAKPLMQGWAKAKSIGPVEAFRQGQKAKQFGAVNQAQVTAAWTDLFKSLYPKFDQGLQAAVKKVNSAPDERLALAALADVSRICMQYEKAVAAWSAKNDARKIVASLVNGPLSKIKLVVDRAELALKQELKNPDRNWA